MLKKIQDAKKQLEGIIQKTPMVKADKIHPNLWIKAENLQATGAFKLRGAYYKLSQLDAQQKAKGVLAASAGNHAQGVAYACAAMNIKGTIVMPKTAPLSKVEATRSYGVSVELVGDTFNDAYAYAKQLQAQTGAVFIEPFDDEDVIAGQGTIGLEILEKMPDVDVVLVPVGGGGLASGIACAIKSLKPECQVYGVEAANAASMKASLDAQQEVTLDSVTTMADGIAVKTPGKITFAMCQKYLDGVVTVSEEEIGAAILTLVEKKKMVAEGAGAVGVAAAQFQKIDLENKKCVAVLSGGNIDVNFLAKIIDVGLMKTGRKVELQVELLDRPGSLLQVFEVLAKHGANIISVEHNRLHEESLAQHCFVRLVLETTSHQHIETIKQALLAQGCQLHKITA